MVGKTPVNIHFSGSSPIPHPDLNYWRNFMRIYRFWIEWVNERFPHKSAYNSLPDWPFSRACPGAFGLHWIEQELKSGNFFFIEVKDFLDPKVLHLLPIQRTWVQASLLLQAENNPNQSSQTKDPDKARTLKQKVKPKEWINALLDIYLRCFVHSCPGLNDFLWQSIEHYLSFVCWILSILKMLYGYEQRLWVIEVMDTEQRSRLFLTFRVGCRSAVPWLITLNCTSTELTNRWKRKLTKAFWSLLPCRRYGFLKVKAICSQSSVAQRANHNPSFRYFGPYKILARVGAVPY